MWFYVNETLIKYLLFIIGEGCLHCTSFVNWTFAFSSSTQNSRTQGMVSWKDNWPGATRKILCLASLSSLCQRTTRKSNIGNWYNIGNLPLFLSQLVRYMRTLLYFYFMIKYQPNFQEYITTTSGVTVIYYTNSHAHKSFLKAWSSKFSWICILWPCDWIFGQKISDADR